MSVTKVYLTFLFFLTAVTAEKTSYYATYVADELCLKNDVIVIPMPLQFPSFMPAAHIFSTTSSSYRANISCTILLETPPLYGLILSIRKISFDSYREDFLQVYLAERGRWSPQAHLKWPVDDKFERKYIISKEGMKLWYHTERRGIEANSSKKLSGFHVIVTAYTAKFASGGCANWEVFECDNGKCISEGLTCDGHNNCGDRSDEGDGGSHKCKTGSWTLWTVILVVMCVIFGVCLVVSGVSWCLLRRKNDDEEEITPPDLPPSYNEAVTNGPQETPPPSYNEAVNWEIDETSSSRRNSTTSRDQLLQHADEGGEDNPSFNPS